jgi:Fe-S-cluster-containing hydrogenase component 2
MNKNRTWQDPGSCTACRACELVCSLHLTGCCDPEASSIRVDLDRSDGSVCITWLPTCNLCEGEANGPLCVRLCTPGALTRAHILGNSPSEPERREPA